MVAIGGGHGLSATLRALRGYAGEITAVVTVADDGGSTGRLRAAMPDLPAPGDVRRCLGALASDEEPFATLLEHRYAEGALAGHALGNLVLVALAAELGSFEEAVQELATRVGAVGRVLPATDVAVALEAVVAEVGEPVVGQVAVQNTSGVRQVRLRPPDPSSSPSVGEAIVAADQVVLGPGSLFTSVLAAAVVPAVREALAKTSAQRVLVANLGPQIPETAGFDVGDEVRALRAHGIEVDVVLADIDRCEPTVDVGCALRCAALASDGSALHDPARLAAALAELAAIGRI